MAAATISVEQEQFSCSVCLEVWRDPVTIPCGHSYCLDCIEDYWNQSKQKSQYSCPQCRQVFNPRPLLSRNTVLGEVVEKFQRGGGSPAADPGDEAKWCSVCTPRRSRAVRRCEACRQAFCAPHCKVHQERFRGKSHRLVPPDEAPPTDLCPQHHKAVRLFCRVDRQGVCSQCVRERHVGHATVPVEEERETQQNKLRNGSLKAEQRLKDTEKELRYIIRYIKHSAEAVTEESDRIFSRLIQAIHKRGHQVKELIRVQERAAVSQAEELLEELHRDSEELRRNQAQLDKLCRSEDHLHFLQRSQSLHFPVKCVELPDTDTLQYVMYKTTRGGVADLRDTIDQTLQRELSRVSEKVNLLKENSNHITPEKTKAKQTDVPYNLEPKSRADFLHYYNDITLDPNTANPYLCFSDGQRVVTTRSEPQLYPDHPDRFTSWAQVLCRAGMAGRCYWEVEWVGKGGVSIGICYKNMSRGGGGSDSKLGHNVKSWSLDCNNSGCSFQHNKESVSIAAQRCSRVGVYLDLRAGTLSFYHVSETMVLLHNVQTTFTQPVYPGFWVGLGSSLKLCSP